MQGKKMIVLASFMLSVGALGAQTLSTPFSYVQTQTSGITGITAGQTARLNAYNPSGAAQTTTSAGCQAEVSFVDDGGNVLKTVQITVAPGKSVAVDLNRDVDLAKNTSSRIELRAAVSFSFGPPPPAATPTTGAAIAIPWTFCSLVPTLEIFDNVTNKTQVVLSDFRYAPYPLPLTGLLGSGIISR